MIARLRVEELEPALRRRLGPRVERLGYLGEFFAVAGHQPAAACAFIEFTEATKAALPVALAELVALTVAQSVGNAYELHQHERLAVRLGQSPDWVAAVERLDPADERLTREERIVAEYVLAALRDHGRGTAQELAAMVSALGEADAVAVMLLTGRFVAHALVANGCEFAPPVPSIFASA
jgi:alkylhydroperoxidase family enzyme